MAWNVDQLQGVLFLAPSAIQMDASQAYTAATGLSPDGYQKAAASPVNMSLANGALGKFQVVIQAQLGRIDLYISPVVDPNTFSNEPPYLNDHSKAFEKAKQLMEKLALLIDVPRVAILCNSHEICSSAEESSKMLQVVTGGVWFPSPAEDAIYQFNVKKRFKDLDLEVNRIFNFTTGFKTLNALQFADLAQGLNQPSVMRSVPIVNLKLDVNCALSSKPLEKSVVVSLISGLISEVLLLLSEGIKAVKNG